MTPWTPEDSAALYNIANWGGGYFAINERGHVVVRPNGHSTEAGPCPEIDLWDLIGQIRRRGVEAPVLLRFDGVLRSRVREIAGAFERASAEYGYMGGYSTVFPIKVNQQRHLVETLLGEGAANGMGIEVGSKPELLAVLGLFAEPGRLIICNGYKDRDYIETALLTKRLGAHPVLVIEKLSELERVLDCSKQLGIRPILGVRTKLGLRGSGRWKESGGDRSKFGLTTRQIVLLLEELERRELLDCLRLLHFHIGSQITRIRSVKDAMEEATRTLVGLTESGARIEWFDVGGGLGVDYDGSSTDFESSMNYSMQEYANDIVYILKR
ncbi:MAG TPA: biosynthetic arginine decarboxylase, partial [Planctomycetes bacterium]|nr:biosynthetic arginine decarboxylase [Planctomycetota bacterium]